MTTHPCITIGMTAYNAADTIEDAVQSALNQDWPEIQIVIVNDKSTDNTAETLTEIAKAHPQIQIIHNKENKGVAAARNIIIEHATGDFIAFFDDDDQSVPQRLQKQYERITTYEAQFANDAPVICHSARTQSYPDGESRYEPTMGTDENTTAPNGSAVAQRILTGKPFTGVFGSTATCSQMARTSLYKQLKGFDPAFKRSEDTDFNIRLSLIGGHFIGIEQSLVTQTMTMANDKKLAEEYEYTIKLWEKHQDFINTKSSYHFCRKWIEAKHDFLSQNKTQFLIKLLKLFFTHPIETSRRIYWALPNIGFNVKLSRFHDEKR